MQDIKKLVIVIATIFVSLVVVAQDYSAYFKAAQNHLRNGDLEKAKAAYSVYVKMSGLNSSDFEEQLSAYEMNALKNEGYVNLGLPSNTCWAKPSSSLYSYLDAKSLTGGVLPSRAQYRELIDMCKWTWTGGGYSVVGPNGNSLYFPANGAEFGDGSKARKGKRGYYWTSDPYSILGLYDNGDVIIQSHVNSSTKSRPEKLSYCLCKVISDKISTVPHHSRYDEVIPVQDVDYPPSFMGGDVNEFSKWVNTRIVYPELAKEKHVTGRVTLQFTIEKDGTLTSVKVLQGVDPLLDEEAVRVVSSSPKWTPGKNKEGAVRVSYTFPVIFQVR